MAINFPNSPTVNDTFTVGGIKFTFTGVKWESGAVVELSSDTTPTLGGNLDGGAKNINNVGVITATGFSGPLTGNATGLTGDPSIQVTNATVLGNLDVQGTTTTIDTAVTEVDSLNVEGSVGIGTTTPAKKLEVAVGNSVSDGILVKGNSSPLIQIDEGSGVSANFGLDGNGSYFGPTSNHYQVFRTNSVERLRITSAGNLGVGNDGSFPLYSGTNDRTLILGTGSEDSAIQIHSGTSNYGGLYFGDATSGSNRYRGYVEFKHGTSDDFLRFGTDAQERLRIDSSGLIGNNGRAPSNYGSPNLLLSGTDSTLTLMGDGSTNNSSYTGIKFRVAGASAGDYTKAGIFVQRQDSYNDLDMIFAFRSTNDAAGVAISDEKVRITSDGTISDSIGPLRRLGIQGASGSFSLAADMAGKLIRSTGNGATLTIPQNIFTAGDMISIFNVSTGNNTIAQGTGTTLYNSADAATGNRTLAAKGMCTIVCTASNEFAISGTQLT